MTKLSVNINKIATLRNSRGGNVPDLLKVAKDIQQFGAQGITIHPRPDERHIRYKDVVELKKVLTTELNIEMYTSHHGDIIITMTDLSGRIILNEEVSASSNISKKISLPSSIPSGVYFVTIKDEENGVREVVKMVK